MFYPHTIKGKLNFIPDTSEPVVPPELSLLITGDGGFVDLGSEAYTINNFGAIQTTAIYNGHKALRYDGFNDYTTLDDAAELFNTGSYEGFLVIKKILTPPPTQHTLTFNKFNEDLSLNYLATSDFFDRQKLGTKTGVASGVFAQETTNIEGVLGLVSFRSNGVTTYLSTNSGADSSVSGAKVNTDDTVTIGTYRRTGFPAGQFFCDMDLCELRIFDTELTVAQRAIQKAELIAKYAI